MSKWSMDSVSFRMAGSGNWQNLLPGEGERRLYQGMYPGGMPLGKLDPSLRAVVASWERANIVETDGQMLVPSSPIVTDGDLEILVPWFAEVSELMCSAVIERLPDYRGLAEALSGRGDSPGHDAGNILAILTCAQTLDLRAFALLRQRIIGPHPPRGDAGRFFFWGYGFAEGPRKILGVTTYIGPNMRFYVIRSRGLDRGEMPSLLRQRSVLAYLDGLCLEDSAGEGQLSEGYGAADDVGEVISSLRSAGIVDQHQPPRLAVPIFQAADMERIDELCYTVSARIVEDITATLGGLELVVERCSFARCSRPDVLCMLFHLAYSYAADDLVEAGIVPNFPNGAGGEWGCWVTL